MFCWVSVFTSCSGYQSLTRYMVSNILSHSGGCLFTLLIVTFEEQKFLILMKSNLPNLSFVACAFGVVLKKSMSNPVLWGFSLMLSSKSFYSFSSFIWIFNPVWVSFSVLWGVGPVSFFFACRYPVFLIPLSKKLSFPNWMVLSLVEIHLIVYINTHTDFIDEVIDIEVCLIDNTNTFLKRIS